MKPISQLLLPICLGSSLLAQGDRDVPVIISFKDVVSQQLLAEHGVRIDKHIYGEEAVTARVPRGGCRPAASRP